MHVVKQNHGEWGEDRVQPGPMETEEQKNTIWTVLNVKTKNFNKVNKFYIIPANQYIHQQTHLIKYNP